MFLNLLRRYHYFIVYSVATPEAENTSEIEEDSIRKLKELRDKKQYKQYLGALTKQNMATNKLNFLNLKIHKFIDKYFRLRGRDIEYFEPCAGSLPLITFAVYGSAGIKGGKMNRNVLIFLLELFAHIKEPEKFDVTADFKAKTKTIDNIKVTIYKIRKA